ncbi:MAG: hypothetical protein L0322_13575, partial [Chloroflexi bacterium]|nr:hypothetical protein [Chloroflexota bacterium]
MPTQTNKRMPPILIGILLLLLLVVSAGCAAPGASPPQVPSPSLAAPDEEAARPTPTLAAAGEVIHGQAMVDSVEVSLDESTPEATVVIVRGNLPDGCTTIDEVATERNENTVTVNITTRRQANLACTEALVPFEERITLDTAGLPAGTYTVTVNGVSQEFQLGDKPAPEPTLPAALPISELVTFDFDEELAASVNAETVPAIRGPNDAAYWLIYPDHARFTFTGYVLADTAQQPQILVFPAEQYANMNQTAAEQIEALQQLLKERPESVEGSLPFLPVLNGNQMFHAQVAYLEFQGGSGVRYLTQYAQEAAPVTNHDLFYAFQGLTDDSGYYIVAVFPVSHPELPADASAAPAGVSEDFDAYLAEVIEKLNAADPASFTPGLEALDQVVTSISLCHSDVANYGSLLEALEKAGATVELTGEVNQPFFAVSGRNIQVNGLDVQVFEYPSEAEAEADAALISSDGFEIGTTIVEWIGTPHFYQRGKVIVLFVGDDADLLSLLDNVLCDEITGGDVAAEVSLEELLTTLRELGLDIQVTQEAEADLLSVPAQVITVNEAQIRVFVYPTMAEAQADAARITANGYIIAGEEGQPSIS